MPRTLEDSLRLFPGVGGVRAKQLEKLGLRTAGDLLGFFPRAYEDRTRLFPIAQAPEGEAVCVAAVVTETPRLSHIRAGLDVTKVKATDGASVMSVTFFNQNYVKTALIPGEEYVFFGKVEGAARAREMKNPVFERRDAPRDTGRIMPVYPLTGGISNHFLSGLVARALRDYAALLPETLPAPLRLEHQLAQAEFSWRNVHAPASWEDLALARRRLVFEELFFLAAGLALLKQRRGTGAGIVFDGAPPEEFIALLPFAPTGAQIRAVEEAFVDMRAGRAMNRLVQGDVGAGKTVVAAACAWLAARSGYQCAIMVPTEVLARQQARALTALLAPAGMEAALLTASMKPSERRRVQEGLSDGRIPLVVGTHALLSEGVSFARLGLVVTDEQHRFGVNQRAALAAKGDPGAPPHVLVMSATPIPRTLALIIYGDLDVSVIDELPPGRLPVRTHLIGEDKRARMYGFVRRLVGEGRQVYLVCPAVEEGEEPDPAMKSVTEHARTLREEVFPDLRVALLHGKMKPREKEAVMAAFADGETDILVATTVIEVGVDVPNAALMVVENAERFGLSQLHQLRGRVGRGPYESHCVLVSDHHGEETAARLRALVGTNDGFQIAEEDLKLRGPGDFFGRRQHGLPQLKVADLAGDMRTLREAQDAAAALLARDPGLKKRENAPILARIRGMFADNADMFQ